MSNPDVSAAAKRLVFLGSIGGALAFGYGCGVDSSGVAGGSGATSGAGGKGTGGGVQIDAGPLKNCSTQAECAPGVCVGGKCCAAEQACSKMCCPNGELCLFEQCVAPGKSCQSESDCADGEYCETALGGAGSGGTGGGSGGSCTEPASAGKCITLPPICGEPGAPTTGCVEKCEYHPPTGSLDPTKKWQWGTDHPPVESPSAADVWSTPTVARVVDANCDGKVDGSDPPNVIFVSGDLHNNCACGGNGIPGTLRVLDGKTGAEIWSLSSVSGHELGFAGVSTALGDINGDGRVDIVALTGDGYVVAIDAGKNVLGVSDLPVEKATAADSFGWGGGIALGDMDGDGSPEIAFGRQVYSTKGGAIKRLFIGNAGMSGGGSARSLSFFADLDGNGTLELVAGNTAYKSNGSALWTNPNVLDGFNAVADFNADGKPDVVVVYGGTLWILQGATGAIELGPFKLPSTGQGGPPTVADFNGDGMPEIGVAQQAKYSVIKPNYAATTFTVLWSATNHDLSSSVTGSSVFDFDGDGKAEVVYNDECFLWVWDGTTGKVLFVTQTESFTGTEASIVADVDGDNHAEIVMISNGADPTIWKCNVAPWNQPDPTINRPAWAPPAGATNYRGITIWGDRQNSWVGTRSLWNQHAYSVSNICDPGDDACDAPNVYGAIPGQQKPNWLVPWLNNFRQNVQENGLFNAPDATVAIDVSCVSPLTVHVSVRNIGLAALPAGVEAGVFIESASSPTELGSVKTTHALYPGQTEVLDFTVTSGASIKDTFFAKLLIDPANKTFNECRDDNDESDHLKKNCVPVK